MPQMRTPRHQCHSCSVARQPDLLLTPCGCFVLTTIGQPLDDDET